MPITDYYVTTDAMGSVMAVLDESGNVLERRSYDAFGEATYMLADGTVVPDSPTGVDIGFQGQLMDELTGMYQMGFRWYLPALGRWVSRDPIGLEDGPNTYLFVQNNAPAAKDNSGLSGCKEVQVRCSTVAVVGTHCEIYYKGFTHGTLSDKNTPDRPNGKGVKDGATLFGGGGGSPKPHRKESKNPNPDDDVYSVTCTCDCDKVERCLKDYTTEIRLPHYAAISGPNSNTYAHRMLTACSCSMDTYVSGYIKYGYGSLSTPIYSDEPRRALNW